MSKCECKNCVNFELCAGWIAYYEDAEVEKAKEAMCQDGENKLECEHYKDKSLFVELPVQVGQTVWYIKGGYYNSPHKTPRAIEVTEINQKWHGKILDWGFIANGTRYRFSSIGKTVFLTKEDAEKKLKEIEENEH